MKQEWFDQWFDTPYYHLLYFKRNDEEAAAFINLLIDYLQPASDAAMLDVACGRGRHALFLSQKGFDVTGIDLSFASILEAKKTEGPQLNFYRHDMRQPFWINYFDYAFNFFTSFGYFGARYQDEAALRTMASALKPNGVLVIDYLNVEYAEKNLAPDQHTIIEGYDFKISRWMDDSHFYKQIKVSHESFDGEKIFTEKVAKFALPDFTAMLSAMGLRINAFFGDYNLGKYHVDNSKRLIMVAEKTSKWQQPSFNQI